MDDFFVKYSGDYSLQYWIKLLLSKDIELPPFQRTFVWKKEQCQELLNSFQNKQYIQPIIIGNYISNNSRYNYIMDGQQRLCTLLFAYLNVFPNEKYKNKILCNEMVEDFDEDEDAINIDYDVAIAINAVLTDIQNKCNNKMEKTELIKQLIDSGKFSVFKDEKYNERFFCENFLSFIYIKITKDNLDESEIKKEQEYYANLFYNINSKSVNLTIQESRNAIVWLYQGKNKDFLNQNIIIKINNKERKIDLLWYLAVLSFIHKNNSDMKTSISLLLKGRASFEKRENIIMDFLKTVVNNEANSKYDIAFLTKDIQINDLIKYCTNDKNYDSIADFEITFIGALYKRIFCYMNFNMSDYSNKIRSLIDNIEGDDKEKYRRSVNSNKKTIDRFIKSIEIYRD